MLLAPTVFFPGDEKEGKWPKKQKTEINMRVANDRVDNKTTKSTQLKNEKVERGKLEGRERWTSEPAVVCQLVSTEEKTPNGLKPNSIFNWKKNYFLFIFLSLICLLIKN